MASSITVAIPVGPEAHHCEWLRECLDSVAAQTEPPHTILLVDDMHGLRQHDGWLAEWAPGHRLGGVRERDGIRVDRYEAPWRLGVPGAFNFGVALARTELVFMLGADDRMLPGCLEACRLAYEREGGRDGYYYAAVRYLDDRDDQNVPCNEAMVTKGLWRATGGFAPETGVGGCDAALISAMMVHKPNDIIRIGEEPLVEYRPHPNTDTAMRGPWQGAILEARRILTDGWRAPTWGRFR